MNAYRQFASEARDPGNIRAIEDLWSGQLRMDIAVPDRAAAIFIFSRFTTDKSKNT